MSCRGVVNYIGPGYSQSKAGELGGASTLFTLALFPTASHYLKKSHML